MATNKPVRIIIYSLLAIVSIILLVSLVVFLINQSATSQIGSGMVEFFIIAMLSAIFLLVSFCLGFLFVRALFRLLGNLAGFSGDKIPIRLVSLGLVAILFPQVTREVIVAPIRFFINFISYFIASLNESFGNLENRFGEIDLQHLIRMTIFTLRDVWAILSRAAIQLFNDLQIPNLIFAIAVWIVLGQILSYFSSRWTDQKTTAHPLVSNLAQKLNPAVRKNILLAIIFMICAYLIMTSIIAVPWLQEVNAVFKENWGQQLDQIIGNRENFYLSYEENYAISPLDTLSDAFLETQSSLDTLPQWKWLISRIRDDRNNLAQQRTMIIDQWKSKRDEVWNIKVKLVTSARSSLNLNVKGMGPVDQAYYYQEISKWLSENCDRLDKNLVQYQKFITYLDSEFDKWSNNILNALNKDAAKLKSMNRADSSAMANIYLETTSVYNPVNLLNQTLYNYLADLATPGLSSLPEAPHPGSQWGIFGYISGWLLRANSYALILITGMLGFGLFGSLISSVVRDYAKPQSGKPLVEDLASAVIRGLSAAVVVFLSAKGGLAVFTTKEVEPNAYVLFFTCLAGAVFSEKIWEWARDRLGKSFSTNQPTDKAAPKEASEEKKNKDG